MIKEKWNEMFSKEGNNKKKVENLIFLLVILVITVLAMNYIWKDEGKKQESAATTSNTKKEENVDTSSGGDNLESRMETILSQLDGVGKVDVLLTYQESTQVVPVYNTSQKVTNTTEGDAGGGKRTIEESDVSQEVVYEDQNGDGKVAVQKEVSPKIEGAIIIATGASNSTVKANIVQAVEAATGLATHKIQVFERQK